MFDLNAILSVALNNAVDARMAELRQQHANIVGELAERIAKLESHHTYMTGVLADRIAILSERVAELEADSTRAATASEGRIREIAEEVAEEMVSEHCGDYDHNVIDDIEGKVRDAVGSMSFEVSVS